MPSAYLLYFTQFYVYLYEKGTVFIPQREVNWLGQSHTVTVGEAGAQIQVSELEVFSFFRMAWSISYLCNVRIKNKVGKDYFLKVRKAKGSILFKIFPLFHQFFFIFQGCSTLEKVGTVWVSQ